MVKGEKNEKSKINVHDMYIAASVSFEVGSLYARHTYPVSMQTFFNQVIKREKRIGGDISSNDVEIVISRNLLPFHLQHTIRMGKPAVCQSLNDYRSYRMNYVLQLLC